MPDWTEARVDVLSYSAPAVKMRSYGTLNTDDNQRDDWIQPHSEWRRAGASARR